MKKNYIYGISAWLLFLTICLFYVYVLQESEDGNENKTNTPFYRTLTDRVISAKEGSDPRKSAAKISTAEHGSFYVSAKDFSILKKAGVPRLWEKENSTTITFYFDPELQVVIAKQIEIDNRKYLEDPQPSLNSSSKQADNSPKLSSSRKLLTKRILLFLVCLTCVGLYIFFMYFGRKEIARKIKDFPLITPPIYQHSENSNKLSYVGLRISKRENNFYIYRDGWNNEFLRITERELIYKNQFFRSRTLSLTDIDYWILIFTETSRHKLSATFYIKDKRDEQIKAIFTHNEKLNLRNVDDGSSKKHETWLRGVCEDIIIQFASITQKCYKVIA